MTNLKGVPITEDDLHRRENEIFLNCDFTIVTAFDLGDESELVQDQQFLVVKFLKISSAVRIFLLQQELVVEARKQREKDHNASFQFCLNGGLKIVQTSATC